MRFQRKPEIVDAIQFTGENVVDVHRFAEAKSTNSSHNNDSPRAEAVTLYLDGYCLTMFPGEWLVRNALGKLDTCLPEVFSALYEACQP